MKLKVHEQKKVLTELAQQTVKFLSGYSVPTIQNATAEELPRSKGRRATYDGRDVVKWVAQKAVTAALDSLPDRDDSEAAESEKESTEALERVRLATAVKIETQNRVRAGELVEKDTIRRQLVKIGRAFSREATAIAKVYPEAGKLIADMVEEAVGSWEEVMEKEEKDKKDAS